MKKRLAAVLLSDRDVCRRGACDHVSPAVYVLNRVDVLRFVCFAVRMLPPLASIRVKGVRK